MFPGHTGFRPPSNSGSFVWMTDTHRGQAYYTSMGPWVSGLADAWGCAAILHTGDQLNNLADENFSIWTYMGRKYIAAAGNHDFLNGGASGRVRITGNWWNITNNPWLGGVYDTASGCADLGSWARVNIGGVWWVVVALPWGAQDAEIEWARSVFQGNNLPGILLVHSYLTRLGARYDWTQFGNDQTYNPHWYTENGYFTDIVPNDGQEIWEKLVSTQGNIKLVLNGHDHHSSLEGARLTSSRSGGLSDVHQVMFNPQDVKPTIQRLVTIDYNVGSISFRTFVQDEKVWYPNTPTDQHNFSLPLNL